MFCFHWCWHGWAQDWHNWSQDRSDTVALRSIGMDHSWSYLSTKSFPSPLIWADMFLTCGRLQPCTTLGINNSCIAKFLQGRPCIQQMFCWWFQHAPPLPSASQIQKPQRSALRVSAETSPPRIVAREPRNWSSWLQPGEDLWNPRWMKSPKLHGLFCLASKRTGYSRELCSNGCLARMFLKMPEGNMRNHPIVIGHFPFQLRMWIKIRYPNGQTLCQWKYFKHL